jgi:hypothetical protein
LPTDATDEAAWLQRHSAVRDRDELRQAEGALIVEALRQAQASTR